MINTLTAFFPRRKKILILWILSNLLIQEYIGLAYAQDVTGPGFTPLGVITPSSISTVTDTWNTRSNILGTDLILSQTGNDIVAHCSNALPNILTPDGKFYGWELAPGSGVYGVIYGSTVTGWIWTSSSYTTKTSIIATWQDNGQASTNGTHNMANCYSSASYDASIALRKNEDTLSGQLKYGVYVDTTAPKAGNYTLSFYLGKYRGTFTPILQTITVSLTACTVSTPSYVRFETVEAGTMDPVISSEGGLEVACEGNLPTVNLSYSVQAVSAARSPTELVMENSQNQTQGIIRGFTGSGADSDAGCSDTASSVRFDATTTGLLVGATNNQSHRFPLKWVLCPERTAPPGEGHASAVVSISWL
ncbi:hypothetical protein ACRZTK_004149 [Enterobacter asburiae]